MSNAFLYVPGQRWASEMEPELGLGILEDISGREISILFRAGDCLRRYSRQSAPVKRVIFNKGDVVKSRDNFRITIQSVEEKSGIVIYHGDGISVPETELADTISFSGPKERLCGGYADSIDAFNLRYKTLETRCRHRKSKSYGFAGCRVDLIKHQFYIADEVSSRHMPRVLLSDETGLGKTIEAGLILHRLLLSERISRVLILVPESLVHQWFVELYRRFNLVFSLFNSDFFQGHVQQDSKNINPFLEAQTGICSINRLVSSAEQKNQVIEAGWDMLVIDEAHHIEEKKDIYSFVKQLSQKVKSMMLLSATPEKPGLKGYFSCLKLLDPLRFHDFDLFLKQARSYKDTVDRIDGILKGKKDKYSLVDNSGNLDLTMEDLLDRYGPGRVIFRNTRSKIKGFPEREEHICFLDGNKKEINNVNIEFLCEIINSHEIDSDSVLQVLKENGFNAEQWQRYIETYQYGKNLKVAESSSMDRKRVQAEKSLYLYDFNFDIRITWLVDFLKQDKNRKILLICKTKEKAAAIDLALQRKINVKKALFHEDLSLIQRDRNAAWFSEKNGARILICSEIGSEGRNFQFAQHLVMFDLPLNPELIEQRIGRLDRIGQKGKIHIHILCIKNSAWEIIIRWYSSGINIFRENTMGAHFIFKRFKKEIVFLAVKKATGKGVDFHESNELDELDELIQKTKKYKNRVAGELAGGRDKLIEFNSFKPEKAEPLIRAVKKSDRCMDTDNFILKLFRYFNVEYENIENRVFHLSFDHAGESGYPVPALKKDGMVVTFDRAKAVTRGDIEFLTLDHPMVTAGMELLTGTEQGNSCFAKISGTGKMDILLESIFILECIAPKELYIDRFLPATPIRIVVGHKSSDFADIVDFTKKYRFDFFEKTLQTDNRSWIHVHPEIIETIIPFLFKKSSEISELKADKIIATAAEKARCDMEKKIARLIYLKKNNPAVRQEEIDAARREAVLVSKLILNAGLRLDAVRLIRQE